MGFVYEIEGMSTTHLKNSPTDVVIAPIFWAWAQQQAAPQEPLHLTRRRAIRMQLQADADLAKAVHHEAFLAIVGVQRHPQSQGRQVRPRAASGDISAYSVVHDAKAWCALWLRWTAAIICHSTQREVRKVDPTAAMQPAIIDPLSAGDRSARK